MKKKWGAVVFTLCLAVWFLHWLGIGYRPSGSAVLDLKAGNGRDIRETTHRKRSRKWNGGYGVCCKTKNLFFTNWNLRNALGKDYEYECRVIFTNYIDGERAQTRTITYRGVDPMGKKHAEDRAYLDVNSRAEEAAITQDMNKTSAWVKPHTEVLLLHNAGLRPEAVFYFSPWASYTGV